MPRDARPEGFSRRHRFHTRGAFGPILGSPRKLRGRLVVIHVASGTPALSRLGVALTRRLVPGARERNGVKRLAREVFRRHPVKVMGLDCVVALRERFAPEQMGPLRVELGHLFDQLAAGRNR
jgi:ribonuclease P protein component